MTRIQNIFFGILIGLTVGLVFAGIFKQLEGWDATISVIIYAGIFFSSVGVYNGYITFSKEIKTTDNDWNDKDHIRWIFNRMKHIHKDEEVNDFLISFDKIKFDNLQWAYNRLIDVHGENKNYDYMIRFKKIIDKQ